jgi:hypothetical protein
MAQERTMALMLMELWAFAYTQDRSVKSRREFEKACRMAEKLALPEVKIYRCIMAGVDLESRRRWRRAGTAKRGATLA